MEGILEKKRRELAIRSDFNICDTYKLLSRFNEVKRGVEANDLQYICNDQLDLPITRDEMFLIFHGTDKNGDGYLDRQEIANCFMPREPQYAEILNERGGFYGEERDLTQIF